MKQYSKSKWRIEIPKIGLVAPIKDGTTQDVLALAVGHFPESNTYKEMLHLQDTIEDIIVIFLRI